MISPNLGGCFGCRIDVGAETVFCLFASTYDIVTSPHYLTPLETIALDFFDQAVQMILKLVGKLGEKIVIFKRGNILLLVAHLTAIHYAIHVEF